MLILSQSSKSVLIYTAITNYKLLLLYMKNKLKFVNTKEVSMYVNVCMCAG